MPRGGRDWRGGEARRRSLVDLGAGSSLSYFMKSKRPAMAIHRPDACGAARWGMNPRTRRKDRVSLQDGGSNLNPSRRPRRGVRRCHVAVRTGRPGRLAAAPGRGRARARARDRHGHGRAVPLVRAGRRGHGARADAAMRERARRRAAQAAARVTLVDGRAEELPFADASFDAAVSAFALCTVADPAAALAELRRVLVPEARSCCLNTSTSTGSRGGPCRAGRPRPGRPWPAAAASTEIR